MVLFGENSGPLWSLVLGDNKKCHHGYRHDLPHSNHNIP